MKPTVGRIVLYTSPEEGAPTLPAIVTGTSRYIERDPKTNQPTGKEEDRPDLAVFTHDGQIGVACCDPKCWAWPKIEKESAPKKEKGKK